MKRSRIVGALLSSLALALVLAACGSDDDGGSGGNANSDGGAVETVTLVQPVPGGPSTFFYPYLVGEELGFFADEGIKVKYETTASDLPLPTFVDNGDADIGAAGATETLILSDKGSDLNVLYDETLKAAENIAVLEDSPVQSMADLEGKTVGTAQQEDAAIVENALRAEGLDEDSVKITNIGEASPAVVNAIKSGKVAAYAAGPSQVAIVQGIGDIKLRDVLPEQLADQPASSFVVKPETLEKRRDALVRFMRAWAMATYVGQVNPEVVAAISRKRVPEEWENPGIAQGILDYALTSRDPGDDPYGTILTKSWETAQQLAIDGEVIKEPVDLDSLLDNSLIEDVNDFDRDEVEAAAKAWADENAAN